MSTAEVHPLSKSGPDIGPLQALLASISNKWVATVFELLTGARELSYGELHRQSQGASRKMLSATLRDLVRDGLVDRRPESRSGPHHVYYRLTELGQSLVATLDELRMWAETHIGAIEAARRTHYVKTEAIRSEATVSRRLGQAGQTASVSNCATPAAYARSRPDSRSALSV
ncbi:winged helix-turn-helix transcriptional regulator [Mycobacterium sp. C31M]